MKFLCVLGRQPAISLAELESLYGSDAVSRLHDDIALVQGQPDHDRLGGTLKVAQLYTVIPECSWNELEAYLSQTLPLQLADMPKRKLQLGFSVHGMHVSLKRLQATALQFKKVLRQQGISLRITPNKHLSLSTAQVYHNQLTAEHGAEIIICRSQDGQIYIGQTRSVQDIDAYSARDQQRPKRDARVGMLPPKLAQIIVNLAAGKRQAAHSETEPPVALTVLDPFCGTGVILQEAYRMGYLLYGTDHEPRMIDYSRENLAWLAGGAPQHLLLEQADATDHHWSPTPDMIAAEAYLGRPFGHTPDRDTLKTVMQDVNTISEKFLRNIAKQTAPGFRMCVAFPAWRMQQTFWRLPVLASLEKLGYNRQSFVHAKPDELIYHRDNQIVGRELTVLTRK